MSAAMATSVCLRSNSICPRRCSRSVFAWPVERSRRPVDGVELRRYSAGARLSRSRWRPSLRPGHWPLIAASNFATPAARDPRQDGVVADSSRSAATRTCDSGCPRRRAERDRLPLVPPTSSASSSLSHVALRVASVSVESASSFKPRNSVGGGVHASWSTIGSAASGKTISPSRAFERRHDVADTCAALSCMTRDVAVVRDASADVRR